MPSQTQSNNFRSNLASLEVQIIDGRSRICVGLEGVGSTNCGVLAMARKDERREESKTVEKEEARAVVKWDLTDSDKKFLKACNISPE